MKNIVILLLITILFVGINKTEAQNINITGAGSTIVNGVYISSDPVTNGGVFYYTKVGTPTIFLYRFGTYYWVIGTALDSDQAATMYYYISVSPDTPVGLNFDVTGVLGVEPFPDPLGDTSLPVELASFTAEATFQGVFCNWTTESEIENLGFILERKTDGNEWTEIANYKTDDGLLGQGSVSYATDYEYIDALVEPNTTYEYRLADVDYNGVITYHSVRTVRVEQLPLASMVEEFTVLPAYPNPFNPTTTIKYGLDNDSKVTIAIYDVAGNLISTLVNTEQTQGWHSVIWNGTNQQGELSPAGIYLSRITSDNEVKTAKLMLLK